MPLQFWRLAAYLAFSSALFLPAQGQTLTTLAVEPLTEAEVGAQTLTQPPAPALPERSGPATGVATLATITHDLATWLLAQDEAGDVVWLKHTVDTGWELRTPPPAELEPVFNRGGQAHILALSAPDESGKVAVYTYHTITDTWAKLGETGLAGQVAAVQPAQDGYIVSATADDGSVQHARITISLSKRLLSWIDWTLIFLYLVATAGIGVYFYVKEKSVTNTDYFLGGRTIPWWAAGFSLYATGTSAISFIAIPAKSFATNWLYLAANILGLFSTIAVALWVVPLIRRLNLTSVYHYLEMRFHPRIRVLASAIAIALQLGGRMSIVLFLPALAIAAVTGIEVIPAILIMGCVTIAYTVMGGMRAVIWTDVIQVFVLLGGAFFAIGYVLVMTDGGIGGFFEVAMADDKFRTFDWSFNLTDATVWGFLIFVILGVLTYPQDQVMMQRVLSTKSDKEAGWSVWTLATIVVPGSLTFFAIGTALYVFYKQHPERLNPLLNVDTTFPQFIAAELPIGVTGLVIAGVFAASMSTLSSCINSVATLVSVDFYERYAKKATPEKSRRLATWMTFVAGAIGVATAILLALVDIKSALDKSFELMALLGGGFAGCYGLGIFTKRANWQGATLGVISSLVITLIAWIFKLVHPYFYMVIAISSCMVVGYLGSYFFPKPTQSLHGLTVYTPRKEPVVLGAK